MLANSQAEQARPQVPPKPTESATENIPPNWAERPGGKGEKVR